MGIFNFWFLFCLLLSFVGEVSRLGSDIFSLEGEEGGVGSGAVEGGLREVRAGVKLREPVCEIECESDGVWVEIVCEFNGVD